MVILANRPRDFAKLLKGNSNHAHDGRFDFGNPISQSDVGKHLNDLGVWHFATDAFCKSWADHLPHITPTEFLQGMFGRNDTNPYNLDAISKLEFDNTGKLTLETHNCKVHDAPVEHYKREFHLGNNTKSVEHSLLMVSPSAQGGGMVKRMFNHIVPLYKKMGISTIDMHAGLEGGAYAWAKYGFNYGSPVAAELHQHELNMGFRSLKTVGLSKEALSEHKDVTTLLDSNHKDKLWLLSDMKTPELDKVFSEDIKHEVGSRGNFIKLLFTETGYHASLSLHDDVSMERLRQYTKDA